ncbi:Asp-tRNA(Asn)/Glu-tRNA(Gln) amidotransferase subunit GatA [Furfurilactobacillus rossiae]|uniref:Glutamyl-tRNA(Gln) amidotransferase subunit A n=1 Tax=Furfurilactobacillus rossiae DSM 15814 TaxID=1114972 RepID=A0A0R1RI12_9LACO|nr:Asp-tRNA(Asn)/Glu-tRNA(Gln) amidotransferase subunit GatA [Furfurilactobacillus rossiae]KRL56423.1 glutamyl-tRNA(Gln) amidotransferase subunit A [Furfurilactobacillus rossiae DSM 15814]QFR67928.1 Asp-tRNA(Asn)/Glu-tRNA(Gln) amidotransferase subunit GatA [Furfurilactobacillus rossiae]QLE60915.1 Aspartyl-tRNAAsn amidotransferase subunit A [Furfurilactobacillus rossiae]
MTQQFDNLTELHQALVNKDLSATELTQQTLTNIHDHEDALNAYVTVNDDEALAQAKQADESGIDADNVFSGVPVAYKDNLTTKGLLTTAASKILYNFKPVYDADVVTRLRAAGAVTIGKTNLDEFAMGGSTETSYFGTVHNPWDTTKVPGGSSGGSAATVAAGDVLAALGSDTGGSIRQPAAFNGIVGLKPTYGRVSRWGLIAFASSLDQIGPMTQNVTDAAAMMNVIAGRDERDATSSSKEVPDYVAGLSGDIKGLKIGVPKEFLGEGIDEGVRDQIKTAIKKLEALGATVDEVSLPHSTHGIQAYYILGPSEASSNLQRFDGIRYGYRTPNAKNLEELYVKTRSEGFGDEVKRRIMLGTFALSAGSFDAFFMKAAKIRTLIIEDFKKVFADYDVIVGPTAPTPAFGIGAETKDPMTMYMNDMLTVPANLAGLPAVSVPAGLVDGLPVGLQVIGRPFDESRVLNTAFAFEQNTTFHELKPSMSKGGRA